MFLTIRPIRPKVIHYKMDYLLKVDQTLWKAEVQLLPYILLLGLIPLNPIVWCYVWLNVVINKVVLLLSKIMVTWIFGHYHITHETHSMWFMWFSHRRYKSQTFCKLKILIRCQWWN